MPPFKLTSHASAPRAPALAPAPGTSDPGWRKTCFIPEGSVHCQDRVQGRETVLMSQLQSHGPAFRPLHTVRSPCVGFSPPPADHEGLTSFHIQLTCPVSVQPPPTAGEKELSSSRALSMLVQTEPPHPGHLETPGGCHFHATFSNYICC